MVLDLYVWVIDLFHLKFDMFCVLVRLFATPSKFWGKHMGMHSMASRSNLQEQQQTANKKNQDTK